MDKIQKIREEVEKRYRENKADGYSDVCEELWDILSFIDSMQQAPASESVDFEKELYKAFGQVKDFTLGVRIAKRFYDMGKNSQEPVSEELEEEIIRYVGYPQEADEDISTTMIRKAARHFANWQKEKMTAKSTDATIGLPYENKDGGYTHLIDVSRPLPVGNNKIAIIFKED